MKKIIMFFIISLFLSVSVKADDEIKIQDWDDPVLGISFAPNNGQLIMTWSEHQIYRSLNGLYSFQPIPVGFANITDLLVVNDLTAFIIGQNGFFAKTVTMGINWELITLSTPITVNLIRIKSTAQGIFVLGDSGLVLKSNDGGQSWSDVRINTSATLRDINFFHQSTTGLIVADDGTVFRTTDAGETWINQTLPHNVSGVRISMPFLTQQNSPDFGENFYVIGKGDLGGIEPEGLIFHMNKGEFTVTKLPESYEPAGVQVSGLNGYAIANKADGLLLRTVDGGNVWTSKFMESKLYSVLIHDYYAYVTGDNGTIYVVPNIITGISSTSNEIPNQYVLSQNYPNPFNPTTKINFSITNFGPVSLRVYDISGKEVVTLVNERLNPGSYQYSFSGNNLSSGTYIYRLQAGDYTETKKMMLIK